jgi:hypothetical protein
MRLTNCQRWVIVCNGFHCACAKVEISSVRLCASRHWRTALHGEGDPRDYGSPGLSDLSGLTSNMPAGMTSCAHRRA